MKSCDRCQSSWLTHHLFEDWHEIPVLELISGWTCSSFPAFRNTAAFLCARSKCRNEQMCFWCVFNVLKNYLRVLTPISGSFCVKHSVHVCSVWYFSCLCFSLMSELSEWFKADPHHSTQEEAVELSGAVQHSHSGECDSGSQWRIHLHSIQWEDGGKCLSSAQSVW